MIYGITYTSGNMNKAATLCRESMLKNGIDEAHIQSGPLVYWQPHEPFYNLNREILSQERGGGYWLWKPYIIYDMMVNGIPGKRLNDGDIFIYSDAGVEFTGPVQPIIEAMDQDIFLFSNGWKHKEWCKMDCIANILPLHYFDWLESGRFEPFEQVQASVIFFKVNQNTRNFVKEWLLYCQMPGLIDDSPSKCQNVSTFAEHRHDQAILTCLQIKYGYKLHYWPEKHWDNQRHRWPNDTYPIMFNQHRKRDHEW